MFCLICSASHSPLANFDVNLVSRSVMIFARMLYLGYTHLRYNVATPSAEMVSWHGIKMVALVQL